MVESPLQAKRLIGYLPENAAAYADMTVHGFLKFAAELRGLAGDARKKAVNRVVELCFLETVLHQSIDTLSKGYRHRTCLAQALIHDPEVLIMDEPTDGLDPNQKHEVRNLIRTWARPRRSCSPPTSSRKSRPPARAPSSSTAAASSPTARRRSCAACRSWPAR